MNSEIYLERQKPRIADRVPKVKSTAEEQEPPALTLATQLQQPTAWWRSDKHTDQQNRTESPEVDPHSYDQLIFD